MKVFTNDDIKNFITEEELKSGICVSIEEIKELHKYLSDEELMYAFSLMYLELNRRNIEVDFERK